MSTPTPETDAAIVEIEDEEATRKSGSDVTAVLKRWVRPNLARKLEQQRDAARKDADELAEALECFLDIGLCKAFHDRMRQSLASHRRLCKLENRKS